MHQFSVSDSNQDQKDMDLSQFDVFVIAVCEMSKGSDFCGFAYGV